MTTAIQLTAQPAEQAVQPILIIGAGQAGAMAANALRGFGYAGALTVVGQEDAAPYERPPLSKTVLLEPDSDDAIHIHPHQLYRDKNIELRLGKQVVRLEPEKHLATLNDGSQVHYEKCLLATGGRARELPAFPSGSSKRVHYIRTLKDAKSLRAELVKIAAQDKATRRPLVVLGGGFLGLEVASTALQLGVETIVLEAAQSLLTRSTPPAFSQWLVNVAQVRGVDLRLGVQCKQIAENPDGVSLELDDGCALNAGIVVAAIGQIANTELAQSAGLQICTQSGGILVDRLCSTSAPDVFSAGDCTTQFQPLLGKAVRLESWQSANEQARIAAAAMLGVTTEPASTPWFWTDMFNMNVQMMGLPQAGLSYVVRGDMTAIADQPDKAVPAKFLIFGLDAKQRLRYALAVNAGGDLRAVRPLFINDAVVDPASLADSAVSLRDLTKRLQSRAAFA